MRGSTRRPGIGASAVSILPWIFLGLFAGYIGGKTVNKPGEAVPLDIALVIVGAVYGGFIFTWMGAAGVTASNLHCMFVEVVGVFATLVVCQAMFGRQRSAPDRGDDRSRFTANERFYARSASSVMRGRDERLARAGKVDRVAGRITQAVEEVVDEIKSTI